MGSYLIWGINNYKDGIDRDRECVEFSGAKLKGNVIIFGVVVGRGRIGKHY